MTTPRILGALALLAGIAGLAFVMGNQTESAPASIDPTPPAAQQQGIATSPPRILPERPTGPATEVLHALGAELGRTHVACTVPAWFEPSDHEALRPAWVHDGVVHAFVEGSGQQTVFRQPKIGLSYSVEEVIKAQKDPVLRAAVLAEVERLGDPKSQAPVLLGALEWDAQSGRCVLHPASDLVTHVVHIVDAEGESTDAYVRAGETGLRTTSGRARFQLPPEASITLTASAAGVGQAMASVVAGQQAETTLILGDQPLPELASAPDWDAALTSAADAQPDDGKAVLAGLRTFIQQGPDDRMPDALADLLLVPLDEKSR